MQLKPDPLGSSAEVAAISIVAGLALIFTGIVNLVAGFMGLFPSLFEASVAESSPQGGQLSFSSLLATSYGRYAVAHLLGAGLQFAGGSCITWLARSHGLLIHGLFLLLIVTLALEFWGWALKGSLSVLSIPGLVAAVLTAVLYSLRLRSRAAA